MSCTNCTTKYRDTATEMDKDLCSKIQTSSVLPPGRTKKRGHPINVVINALLKNLGNLMFKTKLNGKEEREEMENGL